MGSDDESGTAGALAARGEPGPAQPMPLGDEEEARMAAVLAELAARGQSPAPLIPAQGTAPENESLPPEPDEDDDEEEEEEEEEEEAPPPPVSDQPATPLPQVFRLDIQGLRAVAILLVVVYHAGVSQLPGGFVGVDVFFAISGFLITSQLIREVERTQKLRIGRFYARRVLRLLPAASLVVALTLVAGWWWLPATRLRGLVADAVAANLYVLNYRLAVLGTEYRTATDAPSPLQHFWSLAVEEQFYLVVPLLLALTLVALRSRAALAAALALICGVSLWWSVRTSAAEPAWAFLGAETRAWELAAGALLALAAPVLAGRPRLLGTVLRWAGLAMIGYAAWSFDATTPFPGYHAALPVVGALLVIGGGCFDPESGTLLGSGPMRAIGARSYSWYLWHWPVLLILPFVLGEKLSLLYAGLAMLGAYVLADLTYRLVERPVRDATLLRAKPLSAGALGLALTAVVVTIALSLPNLPPRVQLGDKPAKEVTLSGEGTARSRAFSRQLRAADDVEKLPTNLTPPLQEAADDDPAIVEDGCLVSYLVTRSPGSCESYGTASSKTTVVLFGDSHAAQWFPAMEEIARERKWKLAVFTKVVCPAAKVTLFLDAQRGAYDECDAWRADSLARISAMKPALVVATSLADRGDLVRVTKNVTGAWADGWSRTVKSLDQSGARVVYLEDTPEPKGNVPDCLAQHPDAIRLCTQTREKAAGSGRRALMARAAAKAGADVVNVVSWFCTTKRCPTVVGNNLVYRDDSHVSGDYIRLVAPLLDETLSVKR